METGTIRGYFESTSAINIVGTGSMARDNKGRYVNEELEKHWQTFFDGWGSSVEYLVQAQNEKEL